MNKVILIVDDEKAIRQSFVDYFEDKQWEAIEAESGEEALLLIKENKYYFSCALVDIRLKGMDGISFIEKAFLLAPSMIFIICTGSPIDSIPEDLFYVTGLSAKLFNKPVGNIKLIEDEFLRLLKNRGANLG